MALAAAPAAISGVIADLGTIGTVAGAHSISPPSPRGLLLPWRILAEPGSEWNESEMLYLDTAEGRVTALAILKRANPLKDGDAKPPVYGVS